MSTAKMIFHGSDIEKICEVYQLKPEEIVKFGANVNPLGLSEHVKEQLAGRLDIQTEIILHFAAQFQNIVIFLLNSSCPEMVPAN